MRHIEWRGIFRISRTFWPSGNCYFRKYINLRHLFPGVTLRQYCALCCQIVCRKIHLYVSMYVHAFACIRCTAIAERNYEFSIVCSDGCVLQQRVRSQFINDLLPGEADASSNIYHASRFLYAVQKGWYDKLFVCQFRWRIISKCCIALNWGLVCAPPPRRSRGRVTCSI
jgi:hypothetical protein